jgi:hypothetical protein
VIVLIIIIIFVVMVIILIIVILVLILLLVLIIVHIFHHFLWCSLSLSVVVVLKWSPLPISSGHHHDRFLSGARYDLESLPAELEPISATFNNSLLEAYVRANGITAMLLFNMCNRVRSLAYGRRC